MGMGPLFPLLAREPVEDSKDDIVDKELLMKLKTSMITDPFTRKAKTEDKSKVQTQVAFGQGNPSYARSFPTPRSFLEGESVAKLPKEYVEPWDYDRVDYPVTLPLRRPYSGDPEILDEEEFRESSAGRAQDAELTTADELGLMCGLDTPQLFFFQMPSSLPLPQQSQPVAEPNKGSESAEHASRSNKETQQSMMSSSVRGTKLNDLPGGLMGKILVYKSGKVKMKIGDALYNVSAGSNCMFTQEVAVMNTREKHCCALGEVSKRVVVTPDIDYLLSSTDKMDE